MCAGSTVFSAMYGANLSPTARIAILGIGGLGKASDIATCCPSITDINICI